MDTKFHPTRLPGCDLCPEEIGAALARLRFDAMIQVLRAFRNELRQQGSADYERGRTLLAKALFDAVDRMSPLLLRIEHAWKISKPRMGDELAHYPELSEK